MPATATAAATIRFTCGDCDHVIRVPTSQAGRKGKCPRCKVVVRVPGSKQRKPIDDDTEVLSSSFQADPELRAARRYISDRKTPASPVAAVDAVSAARFTDARPARRPASGDSATILKGVLMAIGAVVWFVGGLAAGRVFFYPPILLVLGLVTIARGAMSDGE